MLKLFDYLYLCVTVDYFIFVASKFADFKRLTYWYILILADSQFNAP